MEIIGLIGLLEIGDDYNHMLTNRVCYITVLMII